MPNYAVIFRTHVWDEGIAEMAGRAQACCAAGRFIVAADESRATLSVGSFEKLSHTSDFSSFSLPNIPEHSVLWWNADYVLYAARQKYPAYDYYVMLEYDVFLNCEVDPIVAACAADGIDFVAHHIQPMPENHWSSPSVRDMATAPWWALIPIVILSARAVDSLLDARRAMAARLAEDSKVEWPYCEPFIATAIVQQQEMKFSNLDRFADTELLRFRPFLSRRDPQIGKAGLVAHPVLSGQRFINAFLSTIPGGSHVTTDGVLPPEIQGEDPADLCALFGDLEQMKKDAADTGPGDAAAADNRTPGRKRRDVARNKPATQSSHSIWSHGATAEEDACRAVSGVLPIDYAFHTGGDHDPWWRVDLLDECVVTAVEIFNRPVNSFKFLHFRIESSMDDTTWTIQFTKTDEEPVSGDAMRPSIFEMTPAFCARYVRIVQMGIDVMHLRRIRMLGFPIEVVHAETEEAEPVISEAEKNAALEKAVMSIVHEKIFGRWYDSYNIDALAFLAAGIDSSQYATLHMAKAKRFASASALHEYATSCTPESGLVLEFGVFSGTSINHLAGNLPGRRVFGFDSFEGLPETWRPGFVQGAFRTDIPAVRDNVELVVGWFDRTLPEFVATHMRENLALLHVDCDLYSSTKTIFSLLADRIVAGTIIIFDEYFNYPEWRLHEFKAFQELVGFRNIKYDYIGVVPAHQQVLVRIIDVG